MAYDLAKGVVCRDKVRVDGCVDVTVTKTNGLSLPPVVSTRKSLDFGNAS
jgi:hypothetical protein